jgi:hypothetical protein
MIMQPGNKLVNLLLFIGFKKAFLLLIKLLNYGLTNETIALLRDYFNKRTQVLKVSNLVSELFKISLIVPQG